MSERRRSFARRRRKRLSILLGLFLLVGSSTVLWAARIARIAFFDVSIVGLVASPDPESPVIPKNTESAVRVVVRAGPTALTVAEAVTYLGAGFEVRGTLAGPGLDKPITVPRLGPSDPLPDDPLLLRLPPLSIAGDYQLSNIRIVRDGKALLDVEPSQISVKVIDQILITSVKTRQLTLEEIHEKGIVLDSNSYIGFDFTLGIATDSQSVSFTQTVVFDRQGVPVPQVIEPPSGAPRSGVNLSADLPEPLIIPSLLEVDPAKLDIPDIDQVLRAPSGEPVRIPSVLVIPGNVGFLKQHFSAQLFVANGAPVGSGLSVRDVTGTVRLPKGADQEPGTADDPLVLPDTVRGSQAATQPVLAIGPDGLPGTADDVAVLRPAEQGQAEVVIRGEKEGFHNLDFDIAATLDGLAIGPVPIKGSAKGGVLVRNPFFNMTFTIPSVVRRGETFSVFATVTNIGQSLANDVHVTLDASRTAGATLVGEATQRIDTLRPRDGRTVEFKFLSQRTGQVVATYLNFDTAGQNGGNLKFSMGVGERGVALSPDTLVLPTSVDELPPTVVEAAMRVLGQAWSISNAPAGTLPAEVVRVNRVVATQKALALAEAGLRVSLGQPARAGVRDLAFDFWGGLPLDPGFDQLLRQTHAGHDLARAIGTELAPQMATAGGALPFGRSVDEVAVSGPDYIAIAVGQGTAAAPVTVALADPGGARVDAQGPPGELPRAELPGAVWVPLGGSAAASGPVLGVLTAASSPFYTLMLTGTGSGALDVAVTQPAGDGSFVRGSLSGLAVSAGSQARLVIDRRAPDTLTLQMDAEGDGTFESSHALSVERLSSPGPKLLSATVVGPETIDGSSPFGFHLAALFDRVVESVTAAVPSNYTVPANSVQSAKRQLSGRLVFASLSQPEGPYIPTTFAARGIRDVRGATGPTVAVDLLSRLEDPGAVVSGRVIGADGAPATGAVVTYQNNAAWTCPEEIPFDVSHSGFASVPTDGQGRYEFRYVRQDRCGFPWAMLVRDPNTSALRQVSGFVRAAGEQIVLDIALVGQGTVTGVVRDLAGQPVPGAQVVVVSVTDPQVGGATTTDGDGRYTVSGITVGQVNVRAAKGTGVGSASGSIGRAGSTADVDITIDSGAGSVAGHVRSDDGTTSGPVAGISVVFEAEGTPVAVTQTDALGAYAFTGVPAGAFKIKAAMNKRDRAEVTGTLAAGDALQGVDLVIFVPASDGGGGGTGPGYGTVTGVVRNADNSPEPGVVVSIGDRGVLSGDGGMFEIAGVPVRPGVAQSVLARSRDGLRSGSAVATVNVPGQLVEGVSIVLSGIGSAVFTVVGSGGEPIAGQQVGLLNGCPSTCGCDPQTSGADGKVTFSGLPLGTVGVRAVRSAVGFVDVANATASITKHGEAATGTLRFGGSGVVTGTVRDPQGKPAFGVDIALQSLAFSPDICGLGFTISQRVRTNTLGTFRFQGVNVGPVSVTGSQIFFPNPVTRGGALTNAGQELVLDLVLNEGVSTIAGELTGTVFLPDGKTPAGAGVEVVANGALPDVVVNTDATGKYRFAKIFPEGTYTLTIRDPVTGGVARASVSLRAGQDQTFDVRLLGRGTVLVRVVDAADLPVQTAFVRLRETSFPGRLFEGAVDPAHQGVVTFENVFEGPLSAEASDATARGGRASSTLAGPGATLEMKVRLSMTGKVTGIFVAADGVTPVPFGAVSLTAGGRVIGQTTTQGSGPNAGRFAFDFVPAGPVRVDGQDPATARTGFAVGTITSQGQVVDLKIRAQGLGTVEGRVLSNGAPIAGAEVRLSAGSFRANTTSDAAGRYRVTGVPEGQIAVTADLGRDFLSGTASGNLVGDGSTLILDVPLRGSGKVTGRVVKADGVTPSAPALVSINVGGTGGGALSTVTDGDGRFTFDRVPAGLATLTADVLGSIDRGARTAEVAAAATTDITVTLHGVGSLRVLAVDAIGKPTRGTVVVSGTGDVPYTLSVDVDDTGAFTFPEVLAGIFSASLKVQTETFTLYGSASGTVVQGRENAVTVRVQPSGAVVGRVLRANGTTPAPGAELTLDLVPNRGSLVIHSRADGTFDVRGVPLGPFVLRVRDAFSGGVALVQGKNLTTNGQTVDVNDVILDEWPVAVVSFSPPDQAGQVPITEPVVVTFSDPLASPAGITVSDGIASVPATPVLSADRLSVTLNGSWPDSREITVTATTAVTDIYGRRLAQPRSSRFRTIDLTGPTVTAVAPANDAIEVPADATVVVTFSEPLDPNADVGGVVGLARALASVGGSTVRTSSTTLTFTPAEPLGGDSIYTVTVKGARDLANNLQTIPFTSRFKTRDTQPPILSLVRPPPASWTKSSRPEIEVSFADGLSGIDAMTALLAVNGGPVQPSRSETSLKYTPPFALPDGRHTVEASVADRAGNRGNLEAEFQIDTVLPEPAILTVAENAVLVGQILIEATATDDRSGVREIEALVDGARALTLSGPPPFRGQLDSGLFAEGGHMLSARAIDRAGNVGPAGTAVPVTVDNTGLTATIVAPPVGARVRDALLAKVAVSEPIQRVVFSVGAVTVSRDAAPYEAVLSLSAEPQGPTTLVATVTGLLGEQVTVSRAFEIDRIPPSSPGGVCVEPPENGTSIVLGAPASVEAGATVSATNRGATEIATARADGSFALRIVALSGDSISLVTTDAAGNTSPTTDVPINPTTCFPPFDAALVYGGDIVDLVGTGEAALAPDRILDSVFELRFTMGTGITRQLSFIDLEGPGGIRTTRSPVGAVLGVSVSELGAPVLNHPDRTVDAPLSDDAVAKRVSLMLYTTDDGFIQVGATYTATAVFTNGIRFVGKTTIQTLPAQEVTSAAFSIVNDALPPDVGAPTVTSGEITSSVVSLSNESLPIDPGLPPLTGEVTSSVVSISNESLPIDPGLPSLTGEVTGMVLSLSNESLPFDLEVASPPAEVVSTMVSINNEMPPFDITDPAIVFPVPEVTSAVFSAFNDALPFSSAEISSLPPEIVGTTISLNNEAPPLALTAVAAVSEVTSAAFSINNDPTFVHRVGTQALPGLSCAEILAQGGSVGSGAYWVKPAAGAAFQVRCDMTTLGGGWTQLTGSYGQSLGSSTGAPQYRQYLFSFGERWYASPVTALSWSWLVGQELKGDYAFSSTGTDAGSSVVECSGSSEKPPFGIGCSTGSGSTAKILPFADASPEEGTCTVCQDVPNAFAGPSCQPGVTILVRAASPPPSDGGADVTPIRDGGDNRDASDTGGSAMADATTRPCVSPPDDIRAWWPGDGDTRDIVGGLDGVPAGGVLSFGPGLVDRSFQFDGDDYLTLPDSPLWAFGSEDVTIELWVQSGHSGRMYALSLEPAFGVRNLDFDFNDEDLSVGLWVYWNSTGQSRVTAGAPGAYTDGSWHHVALTRDGTLVTLYVDGIAADSATYVGAFDFSGSVQNYLGAAARGPSALWRGALDEVTVYGRALAPAEIQSIFDAGSAGKCK
jgi:hypothetical protein